jgi:hypothetical protein
MALRRTSSTGAAKVGKTTTTMALALLAVVKTHSSRMIYTEEEVATSTDGCCNTCARLLRASLLNYLTPLLRPYLNLLKLKEEERELRQHMKHMRLTPAVAIAAAVAAKTVVSRPPPNLGRT